MKRRMSNVSAVWLDLWHWTQEIHSHTSILVCVCVMACHQKKKRLLIIASVANVLNAKPTILLFTPYPESISILSQSNYSHGVVNINLNVR